MPKSYSQIGKKKGQKHRVLLLRRQKTARKWYIHAAWKRRAWKRKEEMQKIERVLE